MSVVYQNPFGKKAYQPEVDGKRRWRMLNHYVRDKWRPYQAKPDLRSERSAARVERRRRRYLESVKRNTWEEVATAKGHAPTEQSERGGDG